MGLRKNEAARVTTHCGPHASAWRALNEAELDAWYASEDAKGMTCGGETKLAPRRKWFDLEDGDIVTIVRGRATWTGDIGRPVRNCCVVMTRDGEFLFMKRGFLLPA